VLKYIFLFFLIISLDANDLNISYSYFLEDKIKSDKELFLLKKAIDDKETSKRKYDKLIEELHSFDDVYAMNKYFKKVKQDKSCKVTYSYKNRHFFNFTCKDKKRDKVYIFTKNYISVAIRTKDVVPITVYNMEIINLPIKNMNCRQVCGFGPVKLCELSI